MHVSKVDLSFLAAMSPNELAAWTYTAGLSTLVTRLQQLTKLPPADCQKLGQLLFAQAKTGALPWNAFRQKLDQALNHRNLLNSIASGAVQAIPGGHRTEMPVNQINLHDGRVLALKGPLRATIWSTSEGFFYRLETFSGIIHVRTGFEVEVKERVGAVDLVGSGLDWQKAQADVFRQFDEAYKAGVEGVSSAVASELKSPIIPL